jgi:hypothetical protein
VQPAVRREHRPGAGGEVERRGHGVSPEPCFPDAAQHEVVRR